MGGGKEGAKKGGERVIVKISLTDDNVIRCGGQIRRQGDVSFGIPEHEPLSKGIACCVPIMCF